MKVIATVNAEIIPRGVGEGAPKHLRREAN